MGWLLVSQPEVPDSADIHKVRLGLLGHLADDELWKSQVIDD